LPKAKDKWIVVEPPPAPHGLKRVFYLTTAHFAVNDVALRRVKIARFSDLNDPFELLGVDRSDLDDRATVLKKTREINAQTGLICFSKSWENPVLWGHYAERHAGMCLGFDVRGSQLNDVVYEDSLRSVGKDTRTGAPKITNADIEQLKKTKFKDWEYERETRIFVDLSALANESGKYFFPFSSEFALREIILGPRCEISIKAVRRLAGSEIVVRKARLAFRSFKVVVDKKGSRIRAHAPKVTKTG